MKKITKGLFLSGLLIFAGNCATEKTVSNDVNANNSAPMVGSSSSTAGNSLSNEVGNGNSVGQSLVSDIDNEKRRRLTDSASDGSGNSDMNSVGGQVKPTARDAPDDSTISNGMDTKTGGFVETRVFKSDPVLAKIELVVIDAAHRQNKIYLRNGKILQLPPDNKINLMAASANEILIAARIKTPPPAARDDAKKGAEDVETRKKSEN